MLTHENIPAAEAESSWLMVVLHGLGDSMEGFRWLPEALDLPWLNYLLVNAPDAYGDGFSWYDFQDNPAPGVERSREALFELLDAQRDNSHPADRIFQFGFSQGCLMTMEVAMRYPHRLAGCVGISGYVHEPEAAMEDLSPVAGEQEILFTLGTFDPLIPAEKVKGQLNHLKADGGLRIESHELAKDRGRGGVGDHSRFFAAAAGRLTRSTLMRLRWAMPRVMPAAFSNNSRLGSETLTRPLRLSRSRSSIDKASSATASSLNRSSLSTEEYCSRTSPARYWQSSASVMCRGAFEAVEKYSTRPLG